MEDAEKRNVSRFSCPPRSFISCEVFKIASTTDVTTEVTLISETTSDPVLLVTKKIDISFQKIQNFACVMVEK